MPTPEPPAAVDLSSSPAARFLSGFYSPATSPAALPPVDPDAEGQEAFGFILGPEIGRGGFSVIKRATSASTGAVVAIKIVRTAAPDSPYAAEQRKAVSREVELWTQLSHEHVLPLFSSHVTTRATYFVTLHCPAGSLYDILKTGPPAHDDVGMMFRQVVRGLRYLHELARVVHGDIKLENILVDETGTCKIADFGMARPIPASPDASAEASALDSSSEDADSDSAQPLGASVVRRQTMPGLSVHLSLMRPSRHRPSMPARPRVPQSQHVQPGSLPYAAPELLMPVTRRRKDGHMSPAQDIWAVGVMLYVLLTGGFPFADTFEPRIRSKIIAGVYATPIGISTQAAAVLAGCLQTDMHERWTARRVDEAAWAVGWDDVEAPASSPVVPHAPSLADSRRLSSPAVSRSRSRPGISPIVASPQPGSTGPGPIRTSRSRSSARVAGGRSSSRSSVDAALSGMPELSMSVSSSLASVSEERRGRSRRRLQIDAELSRSPSGPMTPTDDLGARPFMAILDEADDMPGPWNQEKK